MKAELQEYLHTAFGNESNDINCDWSIGGKVHIRFELGDELPNGTRERVDQATERAATIFKETFELENELWVLVYDYQGSGLWGNDNEYLHSQFPPKAFAEFYNQLEMVDTGDFEYDADGNEIIHKQEVRIIIGKLKAKDIGFEGILNAIANTEMGFEPKLNAQVFFIDPATNRIFFMYDDRGCVVKSNKAENIRKMYLERNSWIVDYHRPEIDKYFQ